MDLRLPSLVELARALDLELTLVPRLAIAAVQSIVRSADPPSEAEQETRLAARDLHRLVKAVAEHQAALPYESEDIAQLQRLLRDLQRYRLSEADRQVIRSAHQAIRAYLGNRHLGNPGRSTLPAMPSRSRCHPQRNRPARDDVIGPRTGEACLYAGDDNGLTCPSSKFFSTVFPSGRSPGDRTLTATARRLVLASRTLTANSSPIFSRRAHASCPGFRICCRRDICASTWPGARRSIPRMNSSCSGSLVRTCLAPSASGPSTATQGPPAPDRRHDAAVEDHDGRGPAGRGPAGGVHDDALHLSLGGVQLEFPAVNEASGKMTIPARGVGGSWIVKLPSSRFEGVSENEFSMMTLARLIGMDVPAVRLIDTASIGNLPDGTGSPKGQAFAIERFDRPQGGAPVHIEDFAQVFGVYPEAKYRKAGYRNIATVLRAETTDSDIAEFVRRLVFNVLIGNADMHLKNWSLIYPDRRKAALSPAYDFIDDRLHSRRQGGAHLQRNEAP